MDGIFEFELVAYVFGDVLDNGSAGVDVEFGVLFQYALFNVP